MITSARAIIPNSPASHALTMRERLQQRIDELGLDMLTQLDLIFASKRLPPGYLRFQGYAIINRSHLVYQLDPRRLGNLSISDLIQPDVTARLSAVARKSVRAQFTPQVGLTYSIALSDTVVEAAPEVRLPSFVAFENTLGGDKPLSIPFGVTAAGPQCMDLTQQTHIVIGGASGSGKTSWMHCALAALTMHNPVEQFQFALADYKGDFVHWYDSPHLFAPVARDGSDASNLLDQVVEEMNDRRRKFESVKVFNARQYEMKTGEHLPFLVVFIDEFVDIILEEGNDFITPLKRLSSKARSSGIRLIMSTVNPKADTLDTGIRGQGDIGLCFRTNETGLSAAVLGQGHNEAKYLPHVPGRFCARLPGQDETIMGQSWFIDITQLDQIANWPAGEQVINQQAVSEKRALKVSAQELEWLKWSVEHGDRFGVGRVQVEFGIADNDRSPVRALAVRLEKEKWLDPAENVNRSRKFSPELRAALEAF